MSRDEKGREHSNPCGSESCGIWDVKVWRSQASRELEATLPLRDKMDAGERLRLDGFTRSLRVTLPETIPGSITQAVFVWSNLAADIEALRNAVEARANTVPPTGGTGPGGGSGTFPTLPNLSGSLSIDALRGANFGGVMPLIAAAGLAAFTIWTKPARAIKGKIK